MTLRRGAPRPELAGVGGTSRGYWWGLPGEPEGVNDMPDSCEELPCTVSLLRRADNPVTSNKLKDLQSILKIMDEFGLLMDTPNICPIVIHMSQHSKEELVLEDEIIN